MAKKFIEGCFNHAITNSTWQTIRPSVSKGLILRGKGFVFAFHQEINKKECFLK